MRRQLALETGSPELRASAPTFAEFVETTFRPLHLAVKCRATPVRAYVAELVARGVQARPRT